MWLAHYNPLVQENEQIGPVWPWPRRSKLKLKVRDSPTRKRIQRTEMQYMMQL